MEIQLINLLFIVFLIALFAGAMSLKLHLDQAKLKAKMQKVRVVIKRTLPVCVFALLTTGNVNADEDSFNSTEYNKKIEDQVLQNSADDRRLIENNLQNQRELRRIEERQRLQRRQEDRLAEERRLQRQRDNR